MKVLERFPDAARRPLGLVARAFHAVGEDGEGLLARAIQRHATHSKGPVDPASSTRSFFDALVSEYAASMPPLSAVRAGLAVPFNAYEIVDYLASSAATVREGFERLGRYLQLARPESAFVVDEVGPLGRVVLRDDRREGDWFFDEWTLGVTLRGFRGSLGADFGPTAWGLRRPQPTASLSVAEAVKLVGVAPRYGEPAAYLAFTPEAWHLSLPTHNPHIQSTLLAYAESLIAEQVGPPSTAKRVRELLGHELQGGEPTIERIAKKLATTPRTLQRRLRDEGTSFQEVLDGLRAELARRYLDAGRFDVAEVAFLLGYAEASAFARAFKRWHGVAPTRARGSASGAAQS